MDNVILSRRELGSIFLSDNGSRECIRLAALGRENWVHVGVTSSEAQGYRR